jgi:lipopolysaccharide/colanic/teichoic acid biosynthesis glycosyltransferase
VGQLDREGAADEPGRDRFSALSAAVRRTGCLLVASLGLLCVAPIFLFAALAIRLDSEGPVFFRQRRVGRGGEDFTMLKFRSMYVHATPDTHMRYVAELASSTGAPTRGNLCKLTGDPRVTRVGAFLRRTSIDELPQLLNVITGQMSLVGPRPAVRYELEHYRPEHFERFEVRPGITGLWQVSGRNRLGFNEMLDLDVAYVRQRGLASDVWLLLRTPLAVLRADTA